MAQQLDISQSSIAAFKTEIVTPVLERLDALGETLEKVSKQTEKGSGKSKKDKQKADKGFFKSLASAGNQISLAGPGGARFFGLGKFLDAVNQQKTPMGKFAVGLGQMTVAVFAVTEGLRALGRSLGGMTGREALSTGIDALLKTVGNFGDPAGWRLRSPTTMLKAQTAFAGEFGGRLTGGAMARQADIAADTGLSTQQVTKLQRTLQATGAPVRGVINAFKLEGMLAATAQQELVKAADAIAIAGDSFNSYIKDSILNAKKLGFEFMKVDKKLTGFTMDFEGTVQSFSQLRAVLPGFSVDFGELMTVALTGSTDEYIEVLKEGMVGTGRSIADLNRLEVGKLADASGFSAAELARVIDGTAGEDHTEKDVGAVHMETVEELDTTRNSLATTRNALLVAGFAAVNANILMAIMAIKVSKAGGLSKYLGLKDGGGQLDLFNKTAGKGSRLGRGLSALRGSRFGGAALRAAGRWGPRLAMAGRFGAMAVPGLGLAASVGTLGYMGWKAYQKHQENKVDDFMIKDGELIDINNRDMVGMLPQGQSLSSAGLNSQQSAYGGGFSAQMDNMEMRKQTQAINNLARVMSGPQEISLKNWREAERSAMDASIKEA